MLSMDFYFSNLNIQVSSVQPVATYHPLGSTVVNLHTHYVQNESVKRVLIMAQLAQLPKKMSFKCNLEMKLTI